MFFQLVSAPSLSTRVPPTGGSTESFLRLNRRRRHVCDGLGNITGKKKLNVTQSKTISGVVAGVQRTSTFFECLQLSPRGSCLVHPKNLTERGTDDRFVEPVMAAQKFSLHQFRARIMGVFVESYSTSTYAPISSDSSERIRGDVRLRLCRSHLPQTSQPTLESVRGSERTLYSANEHVLLQSPGTFFCCPQGLRDNNQPRGRRTYIHTRLRGEVEAGCARRGGRPAL